MKNKKYYILNESQIKVYVDGVLKAESPEIAKIII